jgi:hypothetical protein
MEKRDKEPSDQRHRHPNFNRAAISGLKKSRKGKHHGLMLKVIEDLRHSEPGFAVEIPLAEASDTGVLNLRSAILRASAKEGLEINTSSDDKNFYVWKAPKSIKKKA